MTETLSAALTISAALLNEPCCKPKFKDLVRSRVTIFANTYFPDEEFIEIFYNEVSKGDECQTLTYILALFAAIYEVISLQTVDK